MKNRRKKPSKPIRVSPSRFDPSRTGSLRRGISQEMARRFALLKGRIIKLIVDEDSLGLKEMSHDPFAVHNAWSEKARVASLAARRRRALTQLNALPRIKVTAGTPGAPRESVLLGGNLVKTLGPVDTSKETHEAKQAVIYHPSAKISVVELPISHVVPLQSAVSKDSVKHFITQGERHEAQHELPVVVKLPDGRHVLHDGTHRYVADKLSGVKTFKANLYHIESPTKNEEFTSIEEFYEVVTNTEEWVENCGGVGGKPGPCPEGEKHSDEHFDPEALRQAESQNSKSREKLIRMPIRDFIKLAEHLESPSPSKSETVEKVLQAGSKFSDIPHLGFEHTGKGQAVVVSHEGRHRALALEARGYTHLPVKLVSQSGGGGDSIRWGSQHEGYDRLKGEWPKSMRGQTSEEGVKSPHVLSFPIHDLRQTTNVTVNEPWRFEPDAEKIRLFQAWLRRQLIQYVIGKTEEELWQRYTEEGFKKGAGRAFDDARVEERAESYGGQEQLDFYRGTREEFLRSSFGRPVAVEKVQLLASRSFTELKGLTERMATTLTRTLTDGLVQGKGPREIARDLTDVVDIERGRAEVIARTEIIRAHAEGQLVAFKQLGVEELGVAVEWSTAEDEKVCPLCRPLEGAVFKVDEATGMIPRHPQCRCAWIPAGVGEKTADQQRTQAKIVKAVKASRKSEGKKSKWKPARPISKSRPRPIIRATRNYLMTANCGGAGGRPGPCPSSPKKTTASQVRRLLKPHGYDIQKLGGQWVVVGGDSAMWRTSGLHAYRLDETSAEDWVKHILGMAKEHRGE